MTSIFLLATPSCSRRAERGGIDFRPLRTVNHSVPEVPVGPTDHSSKGIRLNSLLPYSVSFFFQPFSWDSYVIAPRHQRAVVSPGKPECKSYGAKSRYPVQPQLRGPARSAPSQNLSAKRMVIRDAYCTHAEALSASVGFSWVTLFNRWPYIRVRLVVMGIKKSLMVRRLDCGSCGGDCDGW
jgi:hypothetical protein